MTLAAHVVWAVVALCALGVTFWAAKQHFRAEHILFGKRLLEQEIELRNMGRVFKDGLDAATMVVDKAEDLRKRIEKLETARAFTRTG